jgi:hypothetical protein
VAWRGAREKTAINRTIHAYSALLGWTPYSPKAIAPRSRSITEGRGAS